jgi:tetratricopeptide (TPR) repeat protein
MTVTTSSKEKDAAKNEIASFSAKAAKLKHEGDAHFGKRNLREALHAYERALQMTLAGTEERAALHSNRAACFLLDNKFQNAAREASSALDQVPGFKPALMRRAKALESLGIHDKAAKDYEAAFKLDGSEETRRKMAEAKANHAARKSGGRRAVKPGGRVPASVQAANAAAARRQQQQQPPPDLVLNCTFEESKKSLTVPISSRFADIVAAVKAKFSEALGDGAVALKYRDFEGDFVTVTSRTDLRSALSTAVSALEREAKRTGKPSSVAPGGLAPVELEVVRVASAPSETPDNVTPENVGRADAAPGDDDDRGEDVIEIDEWLLTFATLFREHLGEAGATEGPLDLRAVGLEKCCEALEEAVGTEKAKALLASAAEKFQEAAAAAIFNWGNVHVCASRKLVDTSEPSATEGAAESQSAPSEAALAAAASTHMARINDEYAKAVERYTQSLAIKSDFYEASIAWGQQAFERGKVLHVASKSGDDAAAKGKLAADADAMFALAEGKFQESLGMIPKEEAEASTSGDAAAPAEEGLSLKSQILVLWGNVLFERSQVKHHRDAKDWQADCDAAVAKFQDAGCVRADIVRALMNHTSGKWAEEKDAEAAAGKK